LFMSMVYSELSMENRTSRIGNDGLMAIFCCIFFLFLSGPDDAFFFLDLSTSLENVAFYVAFNVAFNVSISKDKCP